MIQQVTYDRELHELLERQGESWARGELLKGEFGPPDSVRAAQVKDWLSDKRDAKSDESLEISRRIEHKTTIILIETAVVIALSVITIWIMVSMK